MGYIDEATISAIRRKHPIREVVERYVTLTKKGEDYWGLCPFHADNHASMCVSTRLDMFQCFSCKKAGNVFNFIAGMENMSYKDAISLLAREDGYEINTFSRESPYQKDYEIFGKAIQFYQNNLNSQLGENAIRYLENREIDQETISKFELGLSISKQPLTPFLLNKYDVDRLIDLGLTNTEEKDIFRDRIMIPIHDLNGNPIGFGGRIYQTKDSSKYINTKATDIFDKGNILYNFHRAHTKMMKDEAIIVMEGYFDVIRASTVGVFNCVAPMGTSLTKNHVRILKKITNHIILCFDGDEAGEEATRRAIPLLEEAKMDVKVIRLSEKDPDEFIIKHGRDAFLLKIKNPLSVIDFKMQMIGSKKNLNDTKEVSQYLDEVIQELLRESDEILVELTLKRLAKQFQMEYETLWGRYQQYYKNRQQRIVPEDNFIVKKNLKVQNKYGQATNNLLYYMLISAEVMVMAEADVVMIIDDKKRRLFNEIIYYYHRYGELCLADFITYLNVKTDVSDVLQEIIGLSLKREYTNEEIADYIKCVNDGYRKNIIDKLKLELNHEPDPMKQANILKEIMKIRGVKTSD